MAFLAGLGSLASLAQKGSHFNVQKNTSECDVEIAFIEEDHSINSQVEHWFPSFTSVKYPKSVEYTENPKFLSSAMVTTSGSQTNYLAENSFIGWTR